MAEPALRWSRSISVVIGNDSDRHDARWRATLLPLGVCASGTMDAWILVMPVKPLHAAKSRLRGAADRGVGDPGAHAALTLALAHDTVAAVLEARAVRRLLVISSDPVVAAELAAVGVEVVPDVTDGLNAALSHGAALLRAADPGAPVGRAAGRPARAQARRARRRPARRRRALRRRYAPGVLPGRAGHRDHAAACRVRRRDSTRASAPGRRRATARPAPFPCSPRGRGCAATSTPATTCARPPSSGSGPHTRAVLAPTGRC